MRNCGQPVAAEAGVDPKRRKPARQAASVALLFMAVASLQPFCRNDESLARLPAPQNSDLDLTTYPFVIEEPQQVIDPGCGFPIDRDDKIA